MFTKTRSDELKSKQGSGGTPMDCTSNYFKLVGKPNWRLMQYRVDTKPNVEDT